VEEKPEITTAAMEAATAVVILVFIDRLLLN